MARSKSAPPAAQPQPESTAQALAADAARHGEVLTQHEAELRQIDSMLGLTEGYDRAKYVAAAKDCIHVVGQRMFMLGRICIALKAHEPHGYYHSALEEIGISPRMAQTYARATRVFLETSDGRGLLKDRLPASKLLELVSEPTDDLDALAEGGTVAGLTLDEIETMTVRELKEALRKERKDHADELDARNEISAKKDEVIRKLELKASRLKKAPFRERVEAAMSELGEIVVRAISAADSVRAAMQAIDEMHVHAGEAYTTDVLDMLDGHARAIGAVANDISELAKA